MVYIYMGLEEGPISLLWGLCMYHNDTWTLWELASIWHLPDDLGPSTKHLRLPASKPDEDTVLRARSLKTLGTWVRLRNI